MNTPRDRSIVDWPAPPRPPRRRGRLVVFGVLAVLLLAGGTALSYYVEALWFDSLGYFAVFWKTLTIQASVFVLFAGLTFVALYGAFLAFKPDRLNDITGGTIIINGQPLQLPVEPVLRLIALAAAFVVAQGRILIGRDGLAGQLAADPVGWLGQDDGFSQSRRAQGGGDTARSAADDQDVGGYLVL